LKKRETGAAPVIPTSIASYSSSFRSNQDLRYDGGWFRGGVQGRR
jgi:hypothetical protein